MAYTEKMSSQEFPFKKQRIREALLPLKLGEPVPDAIAVERYRKFYGIDFENQIAGVSASLGTVKAIGLDIVTHVFQQPNAQATVFVFHGLYDHVGIFDKPIRYFLQQGYNVVAYDLPGHGVSSGQLVAVKNFFRYQQVLSAVLAYLQGQLRTPYYAIAQSTGAAVLIEAMLFSADSYPFSKTVLLAPLIRPKNWKRNKAIHNLIGSFVDYIPRNFTFNSHDLVFLKFLREQDILQSRHLSAHWVGSLKKWIPKIESAPPSNHPILVIQGQEDETVDWEHNLCVLNEKFPRMKVSLIPSMRHQVVNESATIREEVFKTALNYYKAESL